MTKTESPFRNNAVFGKPWRVLTPAEDSLTIGSRRRPKPVANLIETCRSCSNSVPPSGEMMASCEGAERALIKA